MNLDFLKPDDDAVLRLARRETSVEHEAAFRPLCLGPAGNFLVLALTGLAAAPFIAWKIVRRIFGWN